MVSGVMDIDSFIFISVALSGCIISSLLWYLFRPVAISPEPVSVPVSMSAPKKKRKKLEVKKSRKLEKEQTVREDYVHVDTSQPFGDKPSFLPCTVSLPGDDGEAHCVAVDSVAPIADATNPSATCDPPIASNDSDAAHQPSGTSLKTDLPISSNSTASPVPDSSVNATTVNDIISTPSTNPSRPAVSGTKKAKSKTAKRVNSSFETPAVCHLDNTWNPVRHTGKFEHSAAFTNQSLQLTPLETDTSLIDYREEITKLNTQLLDKDREVVELTAQLSELSEEHRRLREKEEEHALGYRVLQRQFTELLRVNKSLEHDVNVKESNLQSLTTEKKHILSQLDQVAADATRRKEELDREVRNLQDQVLEAQSKLAVLTNTLPNKNSELIRTQELAQLMSNKNRMLSTTLTQMEQELTQLRQTNMAQQQEVQRLRSENLKARADQESLMEDWRLKQQAQKNETSSRLAALEAELHRRSQEAELEKQDLLTKLSDTRSKLALGLEREKNLAEVVSSMEYQFAELRAEKQLSLDERDKCLAAADSSKSLLDEVANLTNELAHTKESLHEAQLRADRLSEQLEQMKSSCSENDRSHPVACSTSVPGDNSDPLVQRLRLQLKDCQQKIESLSATAENAKKLQELAQLESGLHKATLLQTEQQLAHLQACAQEADEKWRRMLAQSESELLALRKQIARSTRAQSSKRTNSSSQTLEVSTGTSEDAMSQNVDSDFDAVLVDKAAFAAVASSGV